MGLFDLFKSKKETTNHKKTVLNLEIGDIVEYDLNEYKILGTIKYQEGCYEWSDYHLADKQQSFWLYVEDDDSLELGLFEKLPSDHQLYSSFSQGYPAAVEYEGETFNLVEKGQANIRTKGKVGAKTGQKMNYADYQAGEAMISVERWGSALEISIGCSIEENLLEIYPVEEN
ncbi:DUF4178 domain-containing protein [Halanaerobacter jeridensis]|uniref:DUF4178 domain-containing protein n=1 Tax=Halanaerobacter jeridensis TaxID=706427 RepID=A0A938XS56_9FIRM|nr:DUF4178 domain-containing protein [Halanaerobacter jeridensis]MBM7556696.1 hypothetical protein [Halanaerobacter jeridensis]